MNKEVENKIVDVNIEIPSDSNIKYEYDRQKGKIIVDRILRDGFKYPANYGYIAEALDWDGDELDVLVYSSEKFSPGVELKARIVGAMRMIDDGETDTKLIAVHHDDYRLDHIKTLDDIQPEWLEKVQTFFSTYKNWKRVGITKVPGFERIEWAVEQYNEAYDLMQKYGHLSKKEFIDLMKKKFPEKYE
ncbi:MAG: inorganic diphosphatase [Metamycoplasmataceae bacterium]